MSLFITFEGSEGGGKSTQTAALCRWLEGRGVPVVLTHEPGGTELGEKVSDLLKWARETRISPLTELMLFNASRAQLIEEIVRPALKAGKVVICDRFDDSTTAYQSFGRGLDLETVKRVNDTAKAGIRPDLTILLDLSIEDGLARKKGQKLDRFELENIEFHHKVREGYLTLARSEPERWLVIDARQPKEVTAELIRQKVLTLLPA